MLSRVLCAFAISLACCSYACAEEKPTITVEATAAIKAVPDMILLSFGVESTEETVAQSADSTSKKIAAIQKLLRREGIAPRDIKTERLSLEPVHSEPQISKAQINSSPFGSNEPLDLPRSGLDKSEAAKPIAYRATRQLEVIIRDVESFEKVYRGLLEGGVNLINRVSTQSSKIEELRANARLKAMENARTKAEGMAGVLGAKLKSIVRIEDRGESYPANLSIVVSAPDPFGDPFGAGENSAEFNTGEITVSFSVAVVFELKDTEL